MMLNNIDMFLSVPIPNHIHTELPSFSVAVTQKKNTSPISWTQQPPSETPPPQVNPVDTTYFGTFTCKAANLLGENTLDIELFEATVPTALTDVRFEEVTATTITFEMNGPSYDGGLPLISYAVQYKQQGESWDAKQEQQWPVGTTYVVSDLLPERTYMFR